MARRQWLLMFVFGIAAAMFGARAPGQGKGKGKGGKGEKGSKGDHIPGKRWEYTVTKGGMVIEQGTFRADNFKLFNGDNKIGTFTKTGPGELQLDISEGKLKGKIAIKLVRSDPRPLYRGEWEMAGGGTANIQVRFLDD
jgi:hypothetical protein